MLNQFFSGEVYSHVFERSTFFLPPTSYWPSATVVSPVSKLLTFLLYFILCVAFLFSLLAFVGLYPISYIPNLHKAAEILYHADA